MFRPLLANFRLSSREYIYGIYSIEYIYIYTGCNRRNGPDFGRMFLMSYYTDITQNTYVQSRTVTEIIARELLIGVDVLYAVRDVILVQCACPTTRHCNGVTLACALQHGSSDVTR